MWTMKDRLRPPEMNADPRSTSFRNVGSKGSEQALDITPGNVGPSRFGE